MTTHGFTAVDVAIFAKAPQAKLILDDGRTSGVHQE